MKIGSLERELSFLTEDNEETGCHEWMGGRDKDGYGILNWEDKMLRAHRVSYELHKGAIPEGHSVMHSCDNPCCINPEHLTTGTHSENMADMVRKGRSKKCGGYI